MGWIYNGSEFIKADKAQKKAFAQYQYDLTIREALAQPFALPTLAAAGFTLAGIPLGIKLFKTAEDTLQAASDVALKIIDEKIVTPTKPARALAEDIKDCIEASRVSTPFGEIWIPLISGPKFSACALAKGFSKTEAAEFLRVVTTTAGFFI